LRFEGISDRTQAETLRHCQLVVDERDRPHLEEDEYHVSDLIGLEVFDQATQTLVGTVINVMTAGNDLLQVQRAESSAETKDDRVLIPFVKAIVPIVDLENRRIEITPPSGLL
jgi:16S rRNA processing protein RimM